MSLNFFLARLKRKQLTEKEIEHIKDHTPSLKKGSSEMFRNLRDKGIISYTEYLFLLSILTSKYPLPLFFNTIKIFRLIL